MMELEYSSSLQNNFVDSEVSRCKSLKEEFPVIRTLNDLVKELYRAFESNTVNVEHINDIMMAYKSNPREWLKYAKYDRHRYTRNLVDEGNGKFNLMILAWSEGQGSSIHDHSNSHCFMKILDGSLTEVRFAWPQDSEGENYEMFANGETELNVNDVAYINDSLGLHRMENKSHSYPAVSLHLYCPPFETASMFDQRTGHKTKCKVTFWTKYGQRTPYVAPDTKMEDEEYENN